ncbi:MAG: DUF2889 domain-containing protein [Thermodesulfobacteriota bacterium]
MSRTMTGFSRTVVVGAEFPGDDMVRFHAVLEDHVYAMELKMEVGLSDGVIRAVEGHMKRFTTSICPQAQEVVQNAVGISLKQPDWVSRVNREIAHKGCQHLAELILECGRSLGAAMEAYHASGRKGTIPSGPPREVGQVSMEHHQGLHGPCLARPKGE